MTNTDITGYGRITNTLLEKGYRELRTWGGPTGTGEELSLWGHPTEDTKMFIVLKIHNGYQMYRFIDTKSLAEDTALL